MDIQQLSNMDTYEEVVEEEWLESEYVRNFADKSTIESISSLIESSEVTLDNNQFSPIINSCPTTSKILNKNPDRSPNRTPDRIMTPLSINIPRPPLPISPSNSTSSSGVSGRTSCPSPKVKTTKKRKLDSENVYAGAIEALADSIKQPVIVKRTDVSTSNSLNVSDPVDTCMAFIGSILKRIKNERLQFKVMNRLVEMVINVSTQDVQDARDN